MSQTCEFPWPPLASGAAVPRWDGRVFHVGGTQMDVLEYSQDESAWDSDLTGFHEETASVDHPIDVASRTQAVKALASSLHPDPQFILEVGVSSGFLLPLLAEAFPGACVIGSDAFPESLRALARQETGFPLIQFDLTRCPLPDACLDAVVALNVLEHIADDDLALRQIHRVLRPGGVAYVEVPAGPWLYDAYDQMLRHHRRYAASGLKRKARSAGFSLEWLSHLGFLVFPFFAAVKTKSRWLPAKTAEARRAQVAGDIRGSRASRTLAWSFRLETRLGHFSRFPFGIRCLCVLRRPGGEVR